MIICLYVVGTLTAHSSCPLQWYNHPAAQTWNARGINPAATNLPDLAFGSFLTIGAEDVTTPAPNIFHCGVQSYQTNFLMGQETTSLWAAMAEHGTHHSLALWTPTPTCAVMTHVLMAQFTTSGTISGQIQVQIFKWVAKCVRAYLSCRTSFRR